MFVLPRSNAIERGSTFKTNIMIKVDKLSKRYRNNLVLDSITFMVEEGTSIAIIGRNGSGKSSLLKSMLDMVKFDQGDIFYDGFKKERYLSSKIKKQIGAFLGDNILIEELSGLDFLSFIADIYGVDNFKQRIDYLRGIFLFEDSKKFNSESISTYSLGMKRKISLMSALIHTPKYIILDEPFAGLDFIVIKQIFEYLLELKNKNRAHLIFSTHILSHVQYLADNLLLLESGRLMFYGKVSSVDLSRIQEHLNSEEENTLLISKN